MTEEELQQIREFLAGHFDAMPIKLSLRIMNQLLNEVERLRKLLEK